ncbi:hypothetical protein AMAG_07625 [Allomyces macrogynus ATCC 38327]|uniref:Uncharacterized protein n=1 Tax=Allomyces macrogynus (strain ATCC 38327) TaxID=578462 RepID=A0A0L0SIR7_ALLM3|nr:hypothetical protein AMAG_07625 [Allomyces macrogynus ATCC 38327]|eukprot:KNE62403.1 hypothetical protein AMAG_07625 [Allomyces macrogynus ATCC 38327]
MTPPKSFLGLENVHVLVTGASGGLGVALVRQLVEVAGARVTAHHNRALAPDSALAQLARELGSDRIRTVQADVTSEPDVRKAVQGANGGDWGVATVLMLSHGVWPEEDVGVVDMEFARWKRTLAINLDGTFLFIKHWARGVRSAVRSGTLSPNFPHVSVVFVGSTAARFGEAWHADYSASKAAVQGGGLVLSLKNELVKSVHKRARINAVSPGWIRTPMAARAMEDSKLLGQALATTPLMRVAEPEDVAAAMVYLASGTAAVHVTGSVLDLAGGMEGRMLNPPPAAKL